MVFVMMSQRVKDIGLMKAAGCPNDLIFGYFMTELLIVSSVGCILGVVLGVLGDFASTILLNSSGFQISQGPPNVWLVLLVFVLFFLLAVIFGAKPILDTTKVEPAKAISPVYHFGLSKENGFRTLAKSSFTLKLAMRSLFRRKSATLRIILCLTSVFILVTVAVAGGIIADQTTKNWVEKAMGRDIVLIAHQDMANQYKLLLTKFCEVEEDSGFNYTNEEFLVPNTILDQLNGIPEISIETRLVLFANVEEVPGIQIDPETGHVSTVGHNRTGESVIIGVDPEKVLTECYLQGKFLKEDEAQEAVIGDTVAQKIFSVPTKQYIKMFDKYFTVIGVCLDPINNGNVTYVPLKALLNVTGISDPNVIMVRIEPSANRTQILDQIMAEVGSTFEVFELNEALNKNLGFLGHIWSTIMFLPLFSLLSASLCLISYVMLAITEQRQEFGVLRAVGAKPNAVVKIVSEQSLLVLLSSYAIGIAFGIIITLLILVPKPLVTSYTVIEIAGWLLISLAATFILSLYPAIKFAKKPILEILA